MIKLNKEQFIEEIVGKLERIYGQENVQTSIQIKNNGVKFNAITIHRENRQLSPCVYIDKYYEKYKMGIMEIGDVVRRVVQKNEEKMGDDDFDISVLSDYDRACTRIRVRLINTERNGELLLNVPHREFLDLSMIYYIDMTTDKNKDVSILCTRVCNSQMAKWEITEQELYQQAMTNMEICDEGCIISIWDLFRDRYDADFKEDTEKDETYYIMTNKHLIYGANQLLMKNKIKDFAAYLEKDIYIIPSSVNECLLLPICDGTKSPQELCADVVDVNKTLLPQDVLSNHVYKYDRNTEEIFIAA